MKWDFLREFTSVDDWRELMEANASPDGLFHLAKDSNCEGLSLGKSHNKFLHLQLGLQLMSRT
jgi:hypothetical protein